VNRAADLAIAGGTLVLASPLIALAALAVKLEDGGPVLYRQTRVGRDGVDFELLKLRTMVVGAETMGAGLSVDRGDSRITRTGRLLRKLSLDELPQLWNVIRGDMSMVGPRPERPFFVDEFTRQIPFYRARHRVPVGLTGWAQIHGLRGDTSISDRARFDNFYIENWSMWGDVKILLRTFGQVVKAAGR
jgi:lipopolysaccharide/colanic/teichoic acid biosynthesis glycosyltransferase